MAEMDRQQIIGVCFLVAQDALTRCLVQLGKTKGDDWLSEFENELVRGAKGIVTEGIPMNNEIILVENAIQMLNLIFDRARRQIAEESEND